MQWNFFPIDYMLFVFCDANRLCVFVYVCVCRDESPVGRQQMAYILPTHNIISVQKFNIPFECKFQSQSKSFASTSNRIM